jgi:hypothetical protein
MKSVLSLTRPLRRRKVQRGRKLNPRQKKEVKSLIRVQQELKYFVSSALNQALVTNAANVIGTNFDIPQSAGASSDTTRIGDQIEWCGNMEFRFSILHRLVAAGPNVSHSRVLIFQWHDTSQATPFPVAAQIFLNGPTGGIDPWSNYNHDYRHQYRIMYDTQVLTTVATAAVPPAAICNDNTGTRVITKHISMKKASKKVSYVAGGLQASNRFFIYYVSDAAAGFEPLITYSTKVFFRDS